ncbi:hypothetical protein DRN58_07915 [Thermococci archaeon]|nr:MAG: hypothetical protein DRN58_07915 [Thermococci archaeon]
MNRNTKTILMILMVLPIAFYNINIVKSTGGLQVVPSSFTVSVPYDYEEWVVNKYQEKTISLQNTNTTYDIEITGIAITCNTTKWDFINEELIDTSFPSTHIILSPNQPYTFSFRFKSPYTYTKEVSGVGKGFYFGVQPVEFIIEINWRFEGQTTQPTKIHVTVNYDGKWKYLSPYACEVGKEFAINLAGNVYNVKVVSANANSAKIEFDDRIYHTLYVQGQKWIEDNVEPDVAGGSRTLKKDEIEVVLDTTAVENDNYKAYMYFLTNVSPSFTDITPPVTQPPTTAPPTTNPPTTQPPNTSPPPSTSAPPTQIPSQDWDNLMIRLGNIENRLKNIEENDVSKDYVKEEISHAIANIPLSKKADEAYTASIKASAEVKTMKNLMYVAVIISIVSLIFSVQAISKKQTIIEQTEEDTYLDEKRTDIERRRKVRREEPQYDESEVEGGEGW